MTEATQPKTIALDAANWQVLAISNSAQLTQFLQNTPMPTEETIKLIDAHVAKLGLFLHAWMRAAPPITAQAEPAKVAAAADPAPAPAANGAAKRKGGWPKGRSRKPRVVEAVQ